MKYYKIILIVTFIFSFFPWLFMTKIEKLFHYAIYDIHGNITNNVNKNAEFLRTIMANTAKFTGSLSPILLLIIIIYGIVIFIKKKKSKNFMWYFFYIVIYSAMTYFVLNGSILTFILFSD